MSSGHLPEAVLQSTADADLTEFVTVHYDRLLRLARLVCYDATDAGDAVQLGLEKAWRHRSSLRDVRRTRPWLDRIVVRESIRISNRRRSWLDRLRGSHADALVELRDPRADEMTMWVAARSAFAALSAEQRAVVSLHLHSGYSLAETAAMLGRPVETIRSRLRLAKEKLRRDLQEAPP